MIKVTKHLSIELDIGESEAMAFLKQLHSAALDSYVGTDLIALLEKQLNGN